MGEVGSKKVECVIKLDAGLLMIMKKILQGQGLTWVPYKLLIFRDASVIKSRFISQCKLLVAFSIIKIILVPYFHDRNYPRLQNLLLLEMLGLGVRFFYLNHDPMFLEASLISSHGNSTKSREENKLR